MLRDPENQGKKQTKTESKLSKAILDYPTQLPEEGSKEEREMIKTQNQKNIVKYLYRLGEYIGIE